MSAVVLITGASTGFGRNAAERLARRGHQVFATMRDIKGRNAEHGDTLERLAARESLPLHVLELDVTDDHFRPDGGSRCSPKGGAPGCRHQQCRGGGHRRDRGVHARPSSKNIRHQLLRRRAGESRCSPVDAAAAKRLADSRQLRSGARGRSRSGGVLRQQVRLGGARRSYRFELLPLGIDSVLVEPGIYKTPIFDRLVCAADCRV